MRTLGKCIREYKNSLSEKSHVPLCTLTVLYFNHTVPHIISPPPSQLCNEVHSDEAAPGATGHVP